jgi:hypothetical protein
MHDESRCACARTARESVESVRQVFEEDQKLSVRDVSNKLSVIITTVDGILLHDLHEGYPIRAERESVCVRAQNWLIKSKMTV